VPDSPAHPTRRVHLLARGIRKELQSGGPQVRADWLKEALVADLATNGRPELRIPLTAFFEVGARELDVDLDVDDQTGEILVRLVDAKGNPVQDEPDTTGLGGDTAFSGV
jgi:hypothetical protein